MDASLRPGPTTAADDVERLSGLREAAAAAAVAAAEVERLAGERAAIAPARARALALAIRCVCGEVISQVMDAERDGAAEWGEADAEDLAAQLPDLIVMFNHELKLCPPTKEEA